MSSVIKGNLKIEGMHCTSCAMNIDFDLEDLDGVVSAKTSYAKGECDVEFDAGKTNPEEIIAAIKKTGYKAVFIK